MFCETGLRMGNLTRIENNAHEKLLVNRQAILCQIYTVF